MADCAKRPHKQSIKSECLGFSFLFELKKCFAGNYIVFCPNYADAAFKQPVNTE